MKLLNKLFAGVVTTGVGLAATATFAEDIRVGITMRMVSCTSSYMRESGL